MGWKAFKEHYRIGHYVQLVPEKGICIGSAYVHDIIVVSLDGKIARAWDSLRGDELARYLSEIEADPAKAKELLEQPDVFATSIPVFTYEGGEIIECACEELGWPNVTHDGRMMYENTFFPDRATAVVRAIQNARAGLSGWTERVTQAEKELADVRGILAERQRDLAALMAAQTESRAGERDT